MKNAFLCAVVFVFSFLAQGRASVALQQLPQEMEDGRSKIGVAANDYCSFLNAVAASDPDNLYNEKIDCIVRSGEPGSYRYNVILGQEDSTISYVSLSLVICCYDWLENAASTYNVNYCEGAESFFEGYDEQLRSNLITLKSTTTPHDFSTKNSGKAVPWEIFLAEVAGFAAVMKDGYEPARANEEEISTTTQEHVQERRAVSSRALTTMDGGYLFPVPGGGIYNGRRYTEHALERMAPETPEVLELLQVRALKRAQRVGLEVTAALLETWRKQSSGFQDWWRKCRPQPRGVLPSAVEEEIARPGTSKLQVITSEQGDVITVIRREKMRRASLRLSTMEEESQQEDKQRTFFEKKIPQNMEEDASSLFAGNQRQQNIANFKRYQADALSVEKRIRSFANNFETRFRKNQRLPFNKRSMRLSQAIRSLEISTARDAKAKMIQMAQNSSNGFGWTNNEYERTQELRKIRETAVRSILPTNDRAKSAELFEGALEKMKRKAITLHQSIGRIREGLVVKKAKKKRTLPLNIRLKVHEQKKPFLTGVKGEKVFRIAIKRFPKARKKANKKTTPQAAQAVVNPTNPWKQQVQKAEEKANKTTTFQAPQKAPAVKPSKHFKKQNEKVGVQTFKKVSYSNKQRYSCKLHIQNCP